MQTNILIDTGTWMKLEKLIQLDFITPQFISILYEFGKLIITTDIELELNRHNVSSWKKLKTYIIPVENPSLKIRAMEDGFDEADASIFGLSQLHEIIVITEDRPLLKYGKLNGFNFIHFADLLVIFAKNQLLSKNNLYRFSKQLFAMRNIGKKRFKKYKNLAQTL